MTNMRGEIPMSAEAERRIEDASVDIRYTLTQNDLGLIEDYGVLDLGKAAIIGPPGSMTSDVDIDRQILRMTHTDLERLREGKEVNYCGSSCLGEIGGIKTQVTKRTTVVLENP